MLLNRFNTKPVSKSPFVKPEAQNKHNIPSNSVMIDINKEVENMIKVDRNKNKDF